MHFIVHEDACFPHFRGIQSNLILVLIGSVKQHVCSRATERVVFMVNGTNLVRCYINGYGVTMDRSTAGSQGHCLAFRCRLPARYSGLEFRYDRREI